MQLVRMLWDEKTLRQAGGAQRSADMVARLSGLRPDGSAAAAAAASARGDNPRESNASVGGARGGGGGAAGAEDAQFMRE
eukprot:68371-Chlamydomonas_euryale.AAC.1